MGSQPRAKQSPPVLSPAIYTQLRKLARAYLAHERKDHTLAPTALVHEAYLRLSQEPSAKKAFASGEIPALARLMRQILTNHALARKRLKRGGEQLRISLKENLQAVTPDPAGVDLIELDAALDKLAKMHPRHAEVVECRYFLGLTLPETAKALGMSEATVKRHWSFAKTWIFNAIEKKK